MKKFLNFLPLLGMLLLTGCDDSIFGGDDGTSINPSDLAADITEFIKGNYSGYNIESIHIEDVCDVQYYEIELEDGPGPDIELYFTMDEMFAFTAMDIPEAALPQAVLDAIAQEFSNYSIDQDDIEEFELADGSLQYEVELELNGDSDLEVVFNADGTIFCQDNSGSDDDDKDDDNSDDNSNDDNSNDDNSNSDSNDDNNPGGLTASMSEYIQNNYPGYKVEDVEFEDICDDVRYYEVELEDGPGPDIDLYFTLDEVFAFAATEVSKSVLPQAVLDAIAQQFSGYEIDDDKVQQFELADGSLQFEVELEKDSGSDLEIVFNADGSIFCQDDSSDDDD